MTIIKCSGHQFEELVHDEGSVWYCVICRLKVKTREAMEYLSGKPT